MHLVTDCILLKGKPMFWVDDLTEVNGKYWCHLAADSPSELEAVRKKMGLKKEWLHLSIVGAMDAKMSVPCPHYDLKGVKMRDKAIALGAKQLSNQDSLQRLKNAMLGWKLKQVMAFLEAIRPFLEKHEPCGYYCDERVGHIDHRFTNWANLLLNDETNLRQEME